MVKGGDYAPFQQSGSRSLRCSRANILKRRGAKRGNGGKVEGRRSSQRWWREDIGHMLMLNDAGSGQKRKLL